MHIDYSSPQFKYAANRIILPSVLVVLAAASAYALETVGGRGAIAMILTGLIPVISRLQEGNADAQRANEGTVIPSDVAPIVVPPTVTPTASGQPTGTSV